MQTISAWINDLLLFGDDEKETNKIKRVLEREFEVQDLGEPRLLIGMEIS